jgi:elongation factor Tu
MRQSSSQWLARGPWLLALAALTCCLLATGHAQDRNDGGAKPARRIVVLGHEGHGKSTLTAAITRVLSTDGKTKFVAYEELARPSEITIQRVTVPATRVTYETAKARYVHIDCRGEAQIRKLLGRVSMDGAILVVAANDGPMPQTREQIELARKSGIRSMVVYLNKVDLNQDPELLQLVELETRELLSRNGYASVPFIRGSALAALRGTDKRLGEDSIRSLLAAMDQHFR